MTPKQEAFVREYLVDKNATQAAIRAGYSPRSAHTAGSSNMQNPEVKQAVRAALAAQASRTLISADRVLLDIQKFGDEARNAGEFHAALRSRELLGKHFKLFTEKHEHGGQIGMGVTLVISDKDAEL